MYEQSEKNSKFLDAINKSALQHCRDLEEEVKKQARLEMQREEGKIHDECHARMEREVSKIKKGTVEKISAHGTSRLEEISERRQQIQRDVFDKAAQQILESTKSDSYKEQLMKSAKEIGKILHADDVQVFVREEDMVFGDDIQKLFKKCTVCLDKENIIGGIKACSEKQKLFVDDSFLTRLNKQKKWFEENSALKIV